MIEITSWAGALARKLAARFGPRLLFLGYQGSYARGEATPESDIDIVTLLDRLTPADLDTYRETVRSMQLCPGSCLQDPATWPQANVEACGFICGKEELRRWPRQDLLSLALDTRPVLGSLEPYLPAFTPNDRREALSTAAANLYHAACHAYLYEDRDQSLPGLLKAAFFALRLRALCTDGAYHAGKSELSLCLQDREDRDLMDLILSPSEYPADKALAMLISWSSQVIREPEP